MHALPHLAEMFFNWLWRASWQASVVILLVLAVQWLFRNRLSPRWRHALWLLVAVRLILPVSLESPVSVFNWFGPRVLVAEGTRGTDGALLAVEEDSEGPTVAAEEVVAVQSSWKLGAPMLWLAGAIGLLAWLVYATCRLGWRVRRERLVTNGQVLDLLEDCKQVMGVRTPLSVVETAAVTSPSLFGFIRPRLLLPNGMISNFSLPELRYVFLHELGHVKRGDIPVNWLLTIPLALHWFNPLVWFALNRMRVDEEVACDALALAHAEDTERHFYGRTIVKLLENFSRPAAAPGLVGILENNNQVKRRIRMIMRFNKTNHWAALAAGAFGALALVTLTDAQTARPGATAVDGSSGPPRIVSSSPTVGAVDVDPGISEITVTFDQDMGGGFSWTGGGPEYPTFPEGQKPKWVNKRTCALPVKLQPARYYRVGINSTSYKNFKSASGVPANPTAIYFATKGASEEIKRRVSKPQIVGLSPKNGATDADPNLEEVRVTFNVPMGGGFSWTGGGAQYPTIPEGKRPFWTDDKKTCVLPVKLEPGHEYRMGLNSPSHKNFQSEGGVPLDPVVYTFRTR